MTHLLQERIKQLEDKVKTLEFQLEDLKKQIEKDTKWLVAIINTKQRKGGMYR